MVDQPVALPGGTTNIGTAVIKVVGVGGGGCNAVSRMFRERIPEVEYICVNSDQQALERVTVPLRIRVGDTVARGLGVGGDPARGRSCAEESRDSLKAALEGSDLVFVAAGMGGGTGTGAAPVVAEVAQEIGALVIGVVTKPFGFEGSQRMKKALLGIEQLRQKVDTSIVIPNDRLLALSDERLTLDNAFRVADGVLRQGVQAISDLILVPGEINLDFADVRAVMENAGPAWMAIGYGKGDNRAVQAAEEALNSPLLEVTVNGATGVLLNVTGGPDVTLAEVNQAAEVVSHMIHPDANFIFGTVTDPKMESEVKITLIATGFSADGEKPRDRSAEARQALASDEDLSVPPFLRLHPSARSLGSRAAAGNGRGGVSVDQGAPAPATKQQPMPLFKAPARK